MDNPLVSIIIPVYKAEMHLQRCLQSVASQSHADFEAILIDDGSPDGSGKICDQFAQNDPRFVVLHLPNGGVGRARNAGLKAARGLFITFIDADDFVEPDFLGHLVEAQRRNDADLTISRYKKYRLADLDTAWSSPKRGERYFERASFAGELPELYNDIRIGALWNKLFRASLFEGLAYDVDAKIAGDAVLNCQVLGRAQSIELTDASDYHYIDYGSGSITSQNSPTLYLEYLKVRHRIEDCLRENGWVTPEMESALDAAMERYLTRSIHSIRRGPWDAGTRARYIGEVLSHPEMAQTAQRAWERTHSQEFDLMRRNEPARLMRHYALGRVKKKLASALPDAAHALLGKKGGSRGAQMGNAATTPIDFVITWVDGNDPEWQAEKARYNPSSAQNIATAIRYRDWDNLRYWFRAAETLTPWVRRIHFVTYGHTPPWLNLGNPKLHVVKHSDFMPAEYLPTFNSRPIEWNLHRIEGLSEQFVYFNDDMFIIRPMKPTDFFVGGLPKDVGILSPYPSDARHSIAAIVANNMEYVNTNFSRKQTLRRAPYKWFNPKYRLLNRYTLASLTWKEFTGFWGSHFPNNYLKSSFTELWSKEPQILDATCKHKFRNRDDVNHWLVRYWQLASNRFVPREVGGRRYFPLKNDTSPATDAIRGQKYTMVCLNDREGIDDFEGAKKALQQAFEAILPDKSSFEL